MSVRVVEPPKGSLFSFKQYGCKCRVEKHYEDNGTESYWLQITADKDSEIELFHDFKKGLYRIDDEDGKLNDIVHEFPQSYDMKMLLKKFDDKNVFKSKTTSKEAVEHDEETYANEMKLFFETYGFLFPIQDKPILVSVKEVGVFLDRAYMVEQLIAELNNNDSNFGYDYNKLFDYVFILSFSNEKHIYDCRHGYNIIHTIPKHPLIKLIRSIPEKQNEQFTREMILFGAFEPYTVLKKAYNEFDRNIKIEEQEFHQKYDLKYFVEHMYNGEQEYYQKLRRFEQSTINNAVCYIVKDYFTEKNYGKVYTVDEQSDEWLGYFTDKFSCCTEFLEILTATMDQENRKDKLFLDFLIHFDKEVQKISVVDEDSFYPLIMNDVELMLNIKFTERFKTVLLELARETLKNEMNEILKSVVPSFNTDEIAPGWYVPDLFTAIYYSIFLNSGNEKIEKLCANPSCFRTFSVEKDDRKQQYCGSSCGDCMRQRRYKKNKAIRDGKINIKTTEE